MAFPVLAVSGDAAAFCRLTTEGGDEYDEDRGVYICVERGQPLAWPSACLSYAIDSRGSQWMSNEEIEEAVDLAFKTWENTDCGGQPPNLVFKPLQPSTCKRAEYNCDGGNVNTIAFLASPASGEPWEDPCNAPGDLPYDDNAFAVTIVWHDTDTGEIFDADMMINDQLAGRFNAGGPYANCPETGCTGNDADLGSIVTHEAGHFIGIGHCNPENPVNPDPNDPCVVSTMFRQAERESVNKRTLAPDDIDAVCTIYPPGNLDQSCNAVPNGGLQLNCETDADGNEIACSDSTCSTGGSGRGCSATAHPGEAPWGAVVAVLIGFSVWRRRRAAIS
jgi:MYXO-CTERM domain-containing protein